MVLPNIYQGNSSDHVIPSGVMSAGNVNQDVDDILNDESGPSEPMHDTSTDVDPKVVCENISKYDSKDVTVDVSKDKDIVDSEEVNIEVSQEDDMNVINYLND
ncbi:unnamed protein product [Vicia faba]|uniref:Uncharacterized protein n=1 Tax=Vicia faba TaxID=3906 RepID=A0AAV1B0S6_VICFA|nr:unnamed protein product [Vicia faba]